MGRMGLDLFPVRNLLRRRLGVVHMPRSEEHTSELQSHRDLHSFPTRRSSDLRNKLSVSGWQNGQDGVGPFPRTESTTAPIGRGPHAWSRCSLLASAAPHG